MLIFALGLVLLVGASSSVVVQLDTAPASNNTICDEGRNVSVLLQYRLTGSVLSEWKFLAELSPDLEEMRVATAGGPGRMNASFQFRLLQLNHGGGECHCWSVERMEIAPSQQPQAAVIVSFTNATLCSRVSDGENFEVFCGKSATTPRVAVTTKYLIQEGGIEMGGCPDDSAVTPTTHVCIACGFPELAMYLTESLCVCCFLAGRLNPFSFRPWRWGLPRIFFLCN